MQFYTGIRVEDTGFGGNGGEYFAPPPKKSGLGENLISYVFGRVLFLKIYIKFLCEDCFCMTYTLAMIRDAF